MIFLLFIPAAWPSKLSFLQGSVIDFIHSITVPKSQQPKYCTMDPQHWDAYRALNSIDRDSEKLTCIGKSKSGQDKKCPRDVIPESPTDSIYIAWYREGTPEESTSLSTKTGRAQSLPRPSESSWRISGWVAIWASRSRLFLGTSWSHAEPESLTEEEA